MKKIFFLLLIIIFSQTVYADIAVPEPPLLSSKYICTEIKEAYNLNPFLNEKGLYGFKNNNNEVIIEPQYNCDKMTYSTSSRRAPNKWYCCNDNTSYKWATILLILLVIFALVSIKKKNKQN